MSASSSLLVQSYSMTGQCYIPQPCQSEMYTEMLGYVKATLHSRLQHNAATVPKTEVLGDVVDMELYLQAGALEVLGMLLTSLPLQQSHDLLSSSVNDDDCEHKNESTVVQELWLAAVGVLSQVVVHNPQGSKQILQVQSCIMVLICFP